MLILNPVLQTVFVYLKVSGFCFLLVCVYICFSISNAVLKGDVQKEFIIVIIYFTVVGQGHSELVPGRQKDVDAFLVPGFQRRCVQMEMKH